MGESTTLRPDDLATILSKLRNANLDFARRFPGEPGGRQPVHVLYGGAHLFKPDSASRIGALALRSLEEYAPGPADFVQIFGMPDDLAEAIHPRVTEKLRREPVEDYRIDFEDGYGLRPDAEEDGHAIATARALAAGTLPPFVGFRIKALTEDTRERAVRTLDLVLTTLVQETGGRLPENFLITLPKVTVPEQVSALADLFDLLEARLGLVAGSLKMEIMVETPQAVLDLLALAEAARGRCVAAHLGVYDYTAALGVAGFYQTMRHPAGDFARHGMQNALAGTGIRLSDGATTTLPVPLYRAEKGGSPLSPEDREWNRKHVHSAWKAHYEDVWRSLVLGFYQSWDLHPAQLVSRYAAVYGFFRELLDDAAGRLRNFLDQAARATRVGQVFDDAATGQGLLNAFLRGVHCGAISEREALERSGLTLEELRAKSFGKILQSRSR